MKQLLTGVIIGIVISTTMLVSIGVFAQDGIAAFVRPLIVDIQQIVPILADVVVPLDDGTTVTATVPLTVNVTLQVSLSGVVSDSIQVVEETEPAVTIIEPTRVPERVGSLPQEGELTYAKVCVDAPKELTDIKLKKYHETLIGTEILWNGYVYDVTEEADGSYMVQVSIESEEDSVFFTRNVEITGVPEHVAAELDVNQAISYSGEITAIDEMIVDCNPVKIQYGSLAVQ
jgi:hypothetical protein